MSRNIIIICKIPILALLDFSLHKALHFQPECNALWRSLALSNSDKIMFLDLYVLNILKLAHYLELMVPCTLPNNKLMNG